jgi:threonyl-tRNA synthetase
MKSRLELAANLFAASFLEVCPEVVFTAIWTGHLGFYVDYTLPFPMTDEFLKIIEERMREKIKKRESSQIFEMSSRNIVECLKEMKQFKLARELDRSRPSRNIIKIGSYVGVLEDEIDPDLSQIGAIGLEKRGSLVYGVAFEEKEDLKKFRRALKEAEKDDHLVIGDQERFFEKEGEDIYWLPEGVKFRKRIEKKIESFLKELGYEEVEFSGNIEWYEKKGLTKIFTTLEEESDTTFECGLKDQALQKVYYVANSSLQMFQDFAKIISLIFEFQDTQIVCKDFYGIDWGVISQEESGVKISVDRIAAMLVEKRDFLVC